MLSARWNAPPPENPQCDNRAAYQYSRNCHSPIDPPPPPCVRVLLLVLGRVVVLNLRLDTRFHIALNLAHMRLNAQGPECAKDPKEGEDKAKAEKEQVWLLDGLCADAGWVVEVGGRVAGEVGAGAAGGEHGVGCAAVVGGEFGDVERVAVGRCAPGVAVAGLFGGFDKSKSTLAGAVVLPV